MNARLAAAAVLVIAGAVGRAAAQEAPKGERERQGFWIGFGLGAGTGGADCTGCTNERFAGGTGRLAIGGTVNRHLRIGGESHAWVNAEDDAVDETIGNATASVYYYPSTARNFFVQGGLGVSSYTADDGIDEAEATGFAGIIGVGFDIYLGRKFSLTPILAFAFAMSGTLTINGSDAGYGVRPNFLSLTLSPTWH